MNINELSKQIYEQNKAVGWWDDPNRCIWTTIQLISTEIAEATEGERKNLMDDHLPHRKMGEVELADALIRVLDLGGRMGLKYNQNIKHCRLKWRNNAASLHLSLNKKVILFADCFGRIFPYSSKTEGSMSKKWTDLVNGIIKASRLLNYDIEAALMEKLEYNKTREDHKRENREKQNGKKF